MNSSPKAYSYLHTDRFTATENVLPRSLLYNSVRLFLSSFSFFPRMMCFCKTSRPACDKPLGEIGSHECETISLRLYSKTSSHRSENQEPIRRNETTENYNKSAAPCIIKCTPGILVNHQRRNCEAQMLRHSKQPSGFPANPHPQ